MAYARPVVLELSLYIKYFATCQKTVIRAASGLRDLEQLRLTVRFEGESVDKDLPGSLVRVVVALGPDGNCSADSV